MSFYSKVEAKEFHNAVEKARTVELDGTIITATITLDKDLLEKARAANKAIKIKEKEEAEKKGEARFFTPGVRRPEEPTRHS